MSTPNNNVNSLISAVTKLDGSNYHDWVFDIEMIARRAGTWDVLRGTEQRPDKIREAAEWD
jgi:hypothetical protein